MIVNSGSKKKLIDFLNGTNIKFEIDFDLKRKSWLKAGGIFELYIEPSEYSQIIELVNFFNQNNLDFYVVGNLSNIIFRDGKIK